MKIVRQIAQLRKIIHASKSRGTVGLVPTMGDLHEGHLSLIRKSKKENRVTIVTIFVNPMQFDKKKDFAMYHRNTVSDTNIASKAGVDIVFVPSAREIYPPDFQTGIQVKRLAKHLCGPGRPGHFEGVAAIVLKLFNLTQPDRAYFGMKDYQQLRVITQLVKDLNLDLKIIPCPTVREPSGLALSSRNRRLPPDALVRAASIYAALQSAGDLLKSKNHIPMKKSDLQRVFSNRLDLAPRDHVEYFDAVHPLTLEPMKTVAAPALLACAVWISGARLIDNLLAAR